MAHMSSKQEAVTVAARISARLREALNVLAKQLGLTVSKLGRVAVRLYLRHQPTVAVDYELARIAEKFPNNQTGLVSIALSQDEAAKLRELANKLNKPVSHILTLALANILNEPHSTILEDSYAMGTPKKPYPGEKYEKAIAADIINPAKPVNSKTNIDPSDEPQERKDQNAVALNSQDPKNNLEQIVIVGTLIGIPVVTTVLWLAANWKEIQKSLAEFFHAR